jgi:hypothetical protein
MLAMDRSLKSDLLLSGSGTLALIAVLAAIFSDLGAPRPTGAAAIGSVARRANEVRRRYDGSLVWAPLQAGDPVFERDTIFVPEDGLATIALSDGSRLEIDASSLVVLHGAGALDLVEGGAVAAAGRGRITIASRGGTIAVGAGSTADVSGQEVQITGGVAVVTGTAGKITLAAGERGGIAGTALPRAGIGLVAPDPSATVYVGPGRQGIAFAWQESAAGAGPYRLEIAHDRAFESIAAAVDVGGTSALRDDLAPGIYRWRVRRGEETSEERRLVVLPDPPPVPFEPLAGDEVVLPSEGPLTVAWTPIAGVDRYTLEVAPAGSPDSPAVKTDVAHPFWTQRDGMLPNGQWCYRVKSAESDRPGAPWSRSVCFEVTDKPRLRAPQLYDPTIATSTPTPVKKGKK